MGLLDWLIRRMAASASPDTVPFYDVEAQRLVQIPRAELRPGAVQIRIEGLDVDGPVWVLPQQLTPGPIQHEPFDEEVRDVIRRIQDVFAEHRPLSFEEWEDGFRRDRTPMQEIALWSHAADVYEEFVQQEDDAVRRRDIYISIVTCMNTGPDSVWSVLRPETLDRPETETLVDRFYRLDADGRDQMST